jgi:hypothetical protein
VIGVWSEPIKTVASDAKGKGKDALAGKQTRISRSWRLGPGHSGENKHDILTIIEQTSFDLDKVSRCWSLLKQVVKHVLNRATF